MPKCNLREDKPPELLFYLKVHGSDILLMADRPGDDPGFGWSILSINKETGRFSLIGSVGESTGLELTEEGKVVIH